MDRSERFYKIDQMLRERRIVPLGDFLVTLGVSRATFKRDLEYLRDRYNAPIEWDREAGGYRMAKETSAGPGYELPGLWFNAGEIHALLTMQHLLKGLEPGLLTPHVQPLLTRLEKLLAGEAATGGIAPDEIERRIRIIRIAARPTRLEFFELAATAVLKRLRLQVTYWARSSNETTERVLSPQRLVFYRGNWYLDAWCHLRNGLRSFSVDGVRAARLLDAGLGEDVAAKEVPQADLDAALASGYSIFSGRKTTWATLRFSKQAARWVAAEEWHPEQKCRTEPDGSYVMELPYSEDPELVMDILRHGADVEVLAPAHLRERVREVLTRALKQYR
jgi:predicted DNA-binding transcriptional regulator YafY